MSCRTHGVPFPIFGWGLGTRLAGPCVVHMCMYGKHNTKGSTRSHQNHRHVPKPQTCSTNYYLYSCSYAYSHSTTHLHPLTSPPSPPLTSTLSYFTQNFRPSHIIVEPNTNPPWTWSRAGLTCSCPHRTGTTGYMQTWSRTCRTGWTCRVVASTDSSQPAPSYHCHGLTEYWTSGTAGELQLLIELLVVSLCLPLPASWCVIPPV